MESGKIVRICLIGLPLGLVLLGTGSLFYTSVLKPSAEEAAAMEEARRGPIVSVSGIRQQTLQDTLETLTERIGERHWKKPQMLEATKFYLESTLGISNFGYRIKEQIYEVDGQAFTNVAVELPGTKWRDEIIIVGAHYDSIAGTPGADDNASGVAALLALAEVFSGDPQGRTIRFVGFVNEEPPWFETENMGSYRYAKQCQEDGDRIVAMLSLESMGYYSDQKGSQKYPSAIADRYPKTGNFIGIVGNIASKPLVDFTHASFARAETIPVEKGAFPPFIEGVGWSDHWSFWKFNYPAVMITGTAHFRNPNYHKSSDTLDTLDLDRLTQAVIATQTAIEDLANAERLPWMSQKAD